MEEGHFNLWHWIVVVSYVVLFVLGTRYVMRTARNKGRGVFGFPALLVTIVPYIGWLGVIVGLPPAAAGLLTIIVPIAGVIWMKILKPAGNV
jgi:hypothetical protein